MRCSVLQSADTIAAKQRSREAGRLFKSLLVTVASVVLVGVLFTQSSFASGMLDKILKTLSLEHISVSQYETLPEVANGTILYDESGRELGKEVAKIQLDDRATVSIGVSERAGENEMRKLTDPDRLNDDMNFEVGMPEYLPEGYVFDHAEQYIDEHGVLSPKYIDLYFMNNEGKQIYIQEWFADEETAYSMSTEGAIESTKVNGAVAIIMNDHVIKWESEGVLYSVVTKDMDKLIDRSELIRIAESVN
ncbi:DUF4367 domain-containing protein [Paenibacillus donghaensis]|uniref:DUF4367 domain-containing protein n=1 Tax=Paenibacillus donghaensis TaxID=414771 RepID=A0A2Z2KIF3_9BACL|nr:DUF4367 domain-containing protein [Paenibacillus donghaensis]ASA25687.1 hypothetical protein B9T62_36135 [Paenibacillus donghaensis]